MTPTRHKVNPESVVRSEYNLINHITCVCTKCNKELPWTNEYFHWRALRNRHRIQCRSCRKKQQLGYYEKNSMKRIANVKQWREMNIDYIKEFDLERNEIPARKAALKKCTQIRYQQKLLDPKWVANEKKRKKTERSRKFQRESFQRRADKDPLYRLQKNISGSIYQSLKKYCKDPNYKSKRYKTLDILGIDWSGFKKYIENQFVGNMSWEERGVWDLDHIIPISLAKNEDELYELNHYTNFRPLWRTENRKRGNNMDYKINWKKYQ
jgi:hypothetical protein